MKEGTQQYQDLSLLMGWTEGRPRSPDKSMEKSKVDPQSLLAANDLTNATTKPSNYPSSPLLEIGSKKPETKKAWKNAKWIFVGGLQVQFWY